MNQILKGLNSIGVASCLLFASQSYAQDIEIVNPADIAQAMDLNASVESSIDELINMRSVDDDVAVEVEENDGPTVRILISMKERNTTLGEYLNETAIAAIDSNVDRLFELNALECELVTKLQLANTTARVAAEMPHEEGISPNAEQFSTIDQNLGEINNLLGC